ncbi:MAG: hypothetical protein P4L79_10390 [Legionella sp.]|uniref:hypothetical protein n=1 Tax=Legionella sp. TaxID=459 RepID=UPI00284E6BBF|nr:hypothetical protein [Legionella sp.]
MKVKCTHCERIWNDGTKKDAQRTGWRFHGQLAYCPKHKNLQHSLADRDAT